MNDRLSPFELGTADDSALPSVDRVASWGGASSQPALPTAAAIDPAIWRSDDCPAWQAAIIRLVRPVGVAFMFGMLTVSAVLFALLEGPLPGVGARMAGTMAAYFEAIPDIYYWSLIAMYGAYTAARSYQETRK